MMTSKDGKYNIKAVSKKLGIHPGTLRAWERRYQAINPDRNESGHRLYTDEHIAVLRWLIEKVNEGFSIKQAVELKEADKASGEWHTATDHSSYISNLATDFLKALLAFDEEQAQEWLNRAFSMYSMERVAIELFSIAYDMLEQERRQGTITLAHLQYAVRAMEAKITNLAMVLPTDRSKPKILLFCGPHEQSALPLRIFAFYLKRKGFSTICFGTGISVEDAELVVQQCSPSLVAVSCRDEKNIQAAEDWLKQVIKKQPNTKIGLLGKGFSELPDNKKTNCETMFIGKSRADWEIWIERMLQH
ncbi:MerR family transcriptional regulator [Shouchella clausii]|uniref:MerR family transcriptional regulator n=1 Tax=Shouchella clausii TaxID=79880 RepID=UPI002DB97D03|nr:MerR family transcriptional regulator [Shouchella clausii]MEB5479633.1 MerR family transcriptional regulator [Shouchella clausii]